MSSVPPRSIFKTFSQAKPAKKSFGSKLGSLTHQHQQYLQNTTQQTQKNINQLTEKKQRIDRTIPVTQQPIQTHLKGVSNYLGKQTNNLKAKVNGQKQG